MTGENKYLENIQIQEKKRIDALASQNSKQYFSICEDLGIGKDQCEDLLLYEQGEHFSKGNSELEKLLGISNSQESYTTNNNSNKNKSYQNKIISLPKRFITKKTLEELNINDLYFIDHGIHNITIPREMIEKLNPGELIKIYHNAEVLKEYNKHKKSSTIQNEKVEFIPLMEKIYQIKPKWDWFDIKTSKWKKYHTKPFSKRLEELPAEINNIVTSSYLKAWKVSSRQQPNDFDFEDLMRSKNGYVNQIYTTLNKIIHS